MLKLVDLSKSYGDKVIFSNFNFCFPTRGTVCILGPSGRGKTTLLRLIAGLERPDSGQVLCDSQPAMVFQEDRLLPYCSASENIACVLTGKRASRLARSGELLRQVRLAGNEKTPVSDLSGGMKRRVSLARALAVCPEILLLDEPFTGLDQDTHAAMLSLIVDYAREHLVLCVTHDARDAVDLKADVLRL